MKALAKAEAGPYDALLLDLRLPDTTGDQILREFEAAGLAPRGDQDPIVVRLVARRA